MDRKIKNKIQGYRTTDGAGVSLVRVLGNGTVEEFDPILMLDSFDSTDPEDYRGGFPLHPHRGIETISYIVKGGMRHRDSLGHADSISDGELQWMTAGSGIMHEEMIPESERILGVQLWLNLPRKDKMTPPRYQSIKRDSVREVPIEGGKLRLLAGNYREYSGFQGSHLPLDYYDIELGEGAELSIDTGAENSVMIFTLLGEAFVAGELIPEKTAVKLTEGDRLRLKGARGGSRILFMSSLAVKEPAVWGGPIVMNTKEELRAAFRELSDGTFLKEEAIYSPYVGNNL